MKNWFGAIGVLLSAVVSVVPLKAQKSSNTTSVIDDGFKVEWPGEFDPIVAVAGLAPLRSVILPEGHREIRIWIGGGFGYPQDLYRIIDDGKGRVSGSLIFHWPADDPDSSLGVVEGQTFHDVVLYHQRGRCKDLRRRSGVATCVARFTKNPAWGAILRQAEDAGLWSLPDESSLPDDNIIVTDGWGISVELREGKKYRAYSYSNPQAHSKWPEAKRAEAIATAVQAVQRLVPRSSTERIYVGIASSGPSLSEFQECGSRVKWGFQGELTGHSAWSQRPRADTVITGVRRELVRVRGTLTLEWVARQWGSEYSRVLEVSEILSARPTSAATCH